MKKKISNYIFFGYLALLLLIGVSIMIYFRVYLKNNATSRKEVRITNTTENNDMKTIPPFNVLILNNQARVAVVESDSFAADIDVSQLNYVNDTLYIDANQDITLSVVELHNAVAQDESELSLVSFENSTLKVDAQNQAEVDIVLPYLDSLYLKGADECQYNVTNANIKYMEIDLIGKTKLSIVGDVKLLKGSNGEDTEIGAIPKPREVELTGKGI